jgi:hypothetical protein
MKLVIFMVLIFSFSAQASSILGTVSSSKACQKGKTMVWLSKNEKEFSKKELLLHTQVPERGSFEFYVVPGDYLVVASNELGCSVEQPVRIEEKSVLLQLELSESKK